MTETRRRLDKELLAAIDPAYFMQVCGFDPDDWQQEFLRSPSRRLLLNCSRQAGKSSVVAIATLHEALYRPGALALIVSPSLRQSSETFRILLRAYARCHALVSVVQESTLRIEFTNGSRVLSLPGSADTLRGFSAVTTLVLDEAAQIPDPLFDTLTPMLATTSATSRLIALSTPHGRTGWFWRAWSEGEEWTRITLRAEDCPRISASFLREERARLGEALYSQEFGCAFIQTEDQLFSDEVIARMFRRDGIERRPLFGGVHP
jgi:terminase large subunit-like protein